MSEFKPDEKMLQDYIQNKLSAEATEAVELWLVNHPQVMQNLQMDLMLKQGLEEMHADNLSEDSQWFHLPGSSFLQRVGLVAAMAVVFMLGGLTVHFLEKDTAQSMRHPDIIMLSNNRGVETDAVFNRNKDTVIQIPAGYLSDDPYALELSDASQTIYRLDHVKAKDDLLTLFIPKDKLATGLYHLEVTNLTTQERDSYLLQIQ